MDSTVIIQIFGAAYAHSDCRYGTTGTVLIVGTVLLVPYLQLERTQGAPKICTVTILSIYKILFTRNM